MYNANAQKETVEIPDGEWVVLADADVTDCCKPLVRNPENKLKVLPCSGMILGKK